MQKHALDFKGFRKVASKDKAPLAAFGKKVRKNMEAMFNKRRTQRRPVPNILFRGCRVRQ